MSFLIKILGSNSAMPAHDRNHTAQLIKIQNQYFLIDCGEGTQMQLVRYKVRFHRINHIFISHLHGDHYFGLIGLLSTMHLQGRKNAIHIYGPKGLSEILLVQFKYTHTVLNYQIIFHALKPDSKEIIYEDQHIEVETIPLDHRIDCTGFLFREKIKPYKLNKETLPKDLSLKQIATLKKGEDIINGDGQIKYHNTALTLGPKKSRTYAYCSDTRYTEDILPQIKNVDVLYHEATFLKEKSDRAADTFHSTAEQAATIAFKANAGKLMLGHFSTRYKDLDPVLDEAKTVFDNTIIAEEGMEIAIEE